MNKQVTLIGGGMGNPDLLSLAAVNEIKAAEYVIGSRRMLESAANFIRGEVFTCVDADEINAQIRGSKYEKIALLLSGDLGFYSGAKKIYSLLGDIPCKTICGITSAQYLAAKLCRSHENFKCVSGHDKDCNVVGNLLAYSEVFFLTGKFSANEICRKLSEAGLGKLQVTIGERLSYPDEKITAGTAETLANQEFDKLSVVLADNPGVGVTRYISPTLADDDFIRGDVPMTKQEIRNAVISKLKIKNTDIIYDIGAGTGSVSIQIALLAPLAEIYAIEKNEVAVNLIKANISCNNAHNVSLVSGDAPDVLSDLPAPDSAFIGGSSGRLDEILNLLIAKNPAVRVVATAVTLETLTDLHKFLSEKGFADIETVQIAVTNLRTVGKNRMFTAQNPIFIVSAKGGANE